MRRLMLGFVALALSAPTVACGKKESPAATVSSESKPEAKAEPKPEAKPEAKPAEAKPAEAKPVEAKPAEPPAEALPPAKGAWKPVPNSDSLTADVPANAIPNGVGGAAGFHTDDNTFELKLDKVSAEEAAKDMAAVKADTEQFMFKKWIKADATPDGWVMAYEMPKVDGDANEIGTIYAFQVRRKIGSTLYSCNGGLAAAAGLDASIEACNSVRKR